MIAVDTNILVHAHRRQAPRFRVAYDALTRLATGPWAIPWPCVHEFLSIVTHPKILTEPTPVAAALDQIEAWRETGTLRLLADTDGSWGQLRGLLSGAQIHGPRVHDARIAAICLAHGVAALWTADRDFELFPGLTTHNPLTG